MGRNRIFAAALLAAALAAQPAPRFEVAVIRPSASAPGAGTSFETFEGGRVRIQNEPVKLLLRVAFRLQNAQIAGGPNWLDTEPYDVEAKTGRPEKITPDQMGPLMQNLLAERFRLKFHREMRELPVLALLVAKGGPKLDTASEGEAPGAHTHNVPGGSQMVGTAVSMELLANYIGNRMGRIVVDRTALSGSYDFTLNWAPDQAADSAAPPLVMALREQLGLRLESQRALLEVLVIDSIERPSAN